MQMRSKAVRLAVTDLFIIVHCAENTKQ